MANLRNILNFDDTRSDVPGPSSLPDPPSSPDSVSEVHVPEDLIIRDFRDHEFHPNCPDSLNCLPDTAGRPQHTLPVILRCAILGSPRQRLTIREIYKAMEDKYPFYKTAGPTWKQSVRHHLSLNRLFERQPRPVTDPGFGSYWTVNLLAPPGTKRPRKRGRPNKTPATQDDAKKRGRPRRDDPTPTRDDARPDPPLTRELPLDMDPMELIQFDGDPSGELGRATDEEEYESEEATAMMHHPFERRNSLSRMQLSSYVPTYSSAILPRSSYQQEEATNIIERLELEIETLRRQAADAISVSVRLADQLSTAQAESSRLREQLKRTETMLNEESRRTKQAEQTADEEAKIRWALEDEVRRLQGSSSGSSSASTVP